MKQQLWILGVVCFATGTCSSYIPREDFADLRYGRTQLSEVTREFGDPTRQYSTSSQTTLEYRGCAASAWDYFSFLQYVPIIGSKINSLRTRGGGHLALKAGKEVSYVKKCSDVTLDFNRKGLLARKTYRETKHR